MSTKVMVPVEECLRMTFQGPEPEYLDGELLERNGGEDSHSATQFNLIGIFYELRKRAKCLVRPELHLRITPTRYRIADIAVFLEKPAEGIPSTPPLIAIEIVSTGDRVIEIREKLEEYRTWGVRHIWLLDPWQRTFSVYDQSGLHDVPCFDVPELGLTLKPEQVFE